MKLYFVQELELVPSMVSSQSKNPGVFEMKYLGLYSILLILYFELVLRAETIPFVVDSPTQELP